MVVILGTSDGFWDGQLPRLLSVELDIYTWQTMRIF